MWSVIYVIYVIVYLNVYGKIHKRKKEIEH